LGAKAVGIGRITYITRRRREKPGVERALDLMKAELERDMNSWAKTFD